MEPAFRGRRKFSSLRIKRRVRSAVCELDIGRLESGCSRRIRGENLAALVFHFLNFFLDGGDDVIQFLDIFEEIGDVEEGVAIEADIDEGRLHAGKHASDAAFVDATD